jgi:hypothetical protein
LCTTLQHCSTATLQPYSTTALHVNNGNAFGSLILKHKRTKYLRSIKKTKKYISKIHIFLVKELPLKRSTVYNLRQKVRIGAGKNYKTTHKGED